MGLILAPLAMALLALLVGAATWARRRYQQELARQRKRQVRVGRSGGEFAHRLLAGAGLASVTVKAEPGLGRGEELYAHRKKLVVIGEEVATATDVAAVALACRPVGRAMQQAAGAPGFLARAQIRRLVRVGPALIFVAGMVAGALPGLPFSAAGAGILVLWAAIFTANLATLPVEFDAAGRALRSLRDQKLLVLESEIAGVAIVMRGAVWAELGDFARLGRPMWGRWIPAPLRRWTGS
jgi:uncharacterized protein